MLGICLLYWHCRGRLRQMHELTPEPAGMCTNSLASVLAGLCTNSLHCWEAFVLYSGHLAYEKALPFGTGNSDVSDMAESMLKRGSVP